MNKKYISQIIWFIAGVLLLFAAFSTTTSIPRQISGILFGVGSALMGLSLARLALGYYLQHHPLEERHSQIDAKDERSIQIREKAKAKAYDLLMSLFVILFMLLILADVPLWLTLAAVGLYLTSFIANMVYLAKFQQEM